MLKTCLKKNQKWFMLYQFQQADANTIVRSDKIYVLRWVAGSCLCLQDFFSKTSRSLHCLYFLNKSYLIMLECNIPIYFINL